MKALLISSLLVSMAICFWQCKPTKFTVDNLPDNQISWGSGGGFVGKETNYTLLENGQVFKYDGVNDSRTELKSIKKKTAQALFNSITELRINEIALNQPANMYYYIEIAEGDTLLRLTWGDKNKETPKKVKDMYVVLGQLIAESK